MHGTVEEMRALGTDLVAGERVTPAPVVPAGAVDGAAGQVPGLTPVAARAVMNAVFEGLKGGGGSGEAARVSIAVFRALDPIMARLMQEVRLEVAVRGREEARGLRLELNAALKDLGLFRIQALSAAEGQRIAEATLDLMRDQVLELEAAETRRRDAERATPSRIVPRLEMAGLRFSGRALRDLARRVTPEMMKLPVPTVVRAVLDDLVTLGQGAGEEDEDEGSGDVEEEAMPLPMTVVNRAAGLSIMVHGDGSSSMAHV